MTLDKAIEILSDSAHRGQTTFIVDYMLAQKLAIQAMHRLKAYRERNQHIALCLLPGETET